MTNYPLWIVALLMMGLSGCGRQAAPPPSSPAPKDAPIARVAVPAPSTDDPARKKREQIAQALGESDPAVANDIYTILEGLVWVQYGEAHSPEYLSKIKAFVIKAQAHKEISSQESEALAADAQKHIASEKERKAQEKAAGIEHPQPSDSLDMAARRFREAHPELSEYETRKRVANALHTAWPRSASFYFRPNPTLVPPEGAPAAPEIDPAYQHFLAMKGNYWTDPVYEKLAALPSGQIPDGAMIPLLCLTRVPDTSLRRGDEPGVLIDDTLSKCGPRLYPALVAYLADPSKYGHPRDGGIPFHLLQFGAAFTPEQKQALYRAALLSGWNEVSRFITPEPWTAPLLAEFKDSPFGPPR